MIKNDEFKMFLRFLKLHDAYESYISNLTFLCSKHLLEEKIDYFFNGKIKCFSFLSFSFFWVNTKEGDKYWRKLNRFWQEVWCKNEDISKIYRASIQDDVSYKVTKKREIESYNRYCENIKHQ